MEIINSIGFDSPYGYRTIELMHGDLAELSPKVDLLVVSAFAGGYSPTRGTILGMLNEKFDVKMSELVQIADIDLRVGLSLWITPELNFPIARRIICLEMVGSGVAVPEALTNLFAAIALAEAKGIAVGTIAMPLLGTGSQKIDAEEVCNLILDFGNRYLERTTKASKLIIVERTKAKAMLISNELDQILGRKKVQIPKEDLKSAMINDLRGLIHRLKSQQKDNGQAFEELLRLLDKTTVRTSDFGLCCRNFVEQILDEFKIAPGQLHKRIRDFEESKIPAPWICGYLHVLRHFGNQAAHSNKGKPTTIPNDIETSDLIAGLHCLSRVAEFWLEYLSS